MQLTPKTLTSINCCTKLPGSPRVFVAHMTHITFWHSYKALKAIFFTWHCGVQHTTYILSVQRLHLNPQPYAPPPVWEYIMQFGGGRHWVSDWGETVIVSGAGRKPCQTTVPPFLFVYLLLLSLHFFLLFLLPVSCNFLFESLCLPTLKAMHSIPYITFIPFILLFIPWRSGQQIPI